MAYDDFGKKVPSKANKKTAMFTFGDIGGVGQLVYHNFRFADYKLNDEGAETLVIPVIGAEALPDMEQKKGLDGKTILASLCNLAREIDSFETKGNYQDLILDWCRKYMHPYKMDILFQTLTDDEDVGIDLISVLASKDGIFTIQRFMTDLEHLYNAVRFKKALDGIIIADEDDAYNLYEVGRFFEAPALLERFKHRAVEVPDSVIDGADDEDLLSAMEREQEYEKAHPKEALEPGHFASEPYDEYEELRRRLLDMFPDFKLRLRENPKDGRIVLSAEVDSVFDIAWYTLAHLITEEPGPMDMRKIKENPKSGLMATCKCCGKLFFRRNYRNVYCDRIECQNARNAKNQLNYRTRQAQARERAKNRKKD